MNYDGRHYEVLNDLIVSEHDRLLVRTASDYEVNEIFTRRADGTDMLLRSNGELIVTFAGTRVSDFKDISSNYQKDFNKFVRADSTYSSSRMER